MTPSRVHIKYVSKELSCICAPVPVLPTEHLHMHIQQQLTALVVHATLHT